MATTILLSWIGNTDLRAATGAADAGTGPISIAVRSRAFDSVQLLCDYPSDDGEAYGRWLSKQSSAEIRTHFVSLSGPTEYAEIYEVAKQLLLKIRKEFGAKAQLTFHLSPGTPAMAAVWILLGKTSYPAELIESSAKNGVRTIAFPFDLSAEFLPGILPVVADNLALLTHGLPPIVPEFSAIIHRCREMKTAIAEARSVAVHDVPVIIQGESGTGKELFARAIHESSPRQGKPFVEVNCGAIPESLFESEFFGHTAGSFTDAKHSKDGYFEQANEGTLFLDEIGEMPLTGQVKLLRALQEGEVRKIGAHKSKKVSFRVIAATNVNLLEAVGAGKFREDLFHRLAVGLLHLPALRDRAGDLNLLMDFSLEQMNKKSSTRNGWIQKKLSAGARNLLLQHSWPGNVRELLNTISRAAIWTAGETIEMEQVRRAILPVSTSRTGSDGILNRSLGKDFDLKGVVSEVAAHYLKRAQDSSKSKQDAAALLGFANATTFTNWLKKHGLED